MAALITAQLLFLEAENPKKEITIYSICPAGSSPRAWRSTHDAVHPPPVATLCIGQAASMGCCCLPPAPRACAMPCRMPASWCISHRAALGSGSDIERHAQDIIKMKRRLNEIYVRHCGQDSTSRRRSTATISCRPRMPEPSASSMIIAQKPTRSAEPPDSAQKISDGPRDRAALSRKAAADAVGPLW